MSKQQTVIAVIIAGIIIVLIGTGVFFLFGGLRVPDEISNEPTVVLTPTPEPNQVHKNDAGFEFEYPASMIVEEIDEEEYEDIGRTIYAAVRVFDPIENGEITMIIDEYALTTTPTPPLRKDADMMDAQGSDEEDIDLSPTEEMIDEDDDEENKANRPIETTEVVLDDLKGYQYTNAQGAIRALFVDKEALVTVTVVPDETNREMWEEAYAIIVDSFMFVHPDELEAEEETSGSGPPAGGVIPQDGELMFGGGAVE